MSYSERGVVYLPCEVDMDHTNPPVSDFATKQTES